MPEVLERSPLYLQVVDRIRFEIATGILKDGQQLPGEHELAHNFGVSRTVIREAIKTLAANGLVEVRAGAGTFIIDGTSAVLRRSLTLMMSLRGIKALQDIVELREMLEPEIAFKAALHANNADITRLEHAIRVMDQNFASIKEYIAADNQFHLGLAIATRNDLLPHVLESLVVALIQLREHVGKIKDAPRRAQTHHRRLLQAIIDHDPEGARTAMINHLRQVRDDVTLALQEPTNPSS
jgi:GntR family transcriptional regulator, transcriptional repressor for pyruvate dehydrogenase complex